MLEQWEANEAPFINMNVKKLFFKLNDWSLERVFFREGDFDRVDSRLVESSFSSMYPNNPKVQTYDIIGLAHYDFEIGLSLQFFKL